MPSEPPLSEVPRALILAAGVGRRLGDPAPDAPRAPKALLDLGGTSLIARHIAILRACGIASISIVVGFAADRIRAAVADDPGVSLLFNEDFRAGSVVSLWTGRDVLRGGDPVILMDADVLYDRRLMARLIASRHANCLLLDRAIEPGDEPVKLCVRRGRIVDFRKIPTEAHDWHGESVGFFRFCPTTARELADRAGAYVAGGRRGMEYEEPIRDMIMAAEADRFGFEDISGLPWTEIDFPEDLVKARALLPDLAP